MHGSFVKNRWDMNHDNFYDAPNRQQVNALYRIIYDGPRGCAQFNVQALTDRRTSGQIRELPISTGFFGVNQRNDRVEAWVKYGKEGLFGKPYNELGNMASVSWHHTHSVFGTNVYDATQQSLYIQSLFQTIIQSTMHKIVVAPSLQYDNIQEKVNEGDLSRKDVVPGAMLEYTFNHPTLRMEGPDFVLVAGARIDHNSRFGWQFTPRMSAKYNFTEKSVVRVSGGLGYRSPNLLAENLSLLASNRALHFASDLSYEKAWNYGINFTQSFKIAGRNASFSLDGYRTDFIRQVIVDVDQSPTSVFFYNLNGKSYSNSILAVAQYNVFQGFEMKLSYKRNDVKTTYANGVVRTPPLVAKYRGLITLDYTTPNKKWMFNLRTHIVGPQRLPDNGQIPHEYLHGFVEISPVYTIWSGQITRSWKNIEVYVGMENISNYQQHHAIIAANEPNSPYFNGSQIWAPMMGKVASVGLRYAPGGLR
jgi:outer membrane receptor for ferrienterochelin and colicin